MGATLILLLWSILLFISYLVVIVMLANWIIRRFLK